MVYVVINDETQMRVQDSGSGRVYAIDGCYKLVLTYFDEKDSADRPSSCFLPKPLFHTTRPCKEFDVPPIHPGEKAIQSCPSTLPSDE